MKDLSREIKPPKPEGISKNQWKKQLKQLDFLKKKDKIKEARRIKRTQTKLKQKELGIKRKKPAQLSGFKVLIDLSFDDKMTEKEIQSTCVQLGFSYASARAYGLTLTLTSLSKRIDDVMKNVTPEYKNWSCIQSSDHFSLLNPLDIINNTTIAVDTADAIDSTVEAGDSADIVDVVDAADIVDTNAADSAVEPSNESVQGAASVELKETAETAESTDKIEPITYCYLTADSDNEITELDKSTIYIIGGLVDKNRYKNLCLEEAKKYNITHARLPISKYIKLSTRKVLTINHVVEILGYYSVNGDWEAAFLKALPSRKEPVPISTTDNGSEVIEDIIITKDDDIITEEKMDDLE